MIVLRLRILPMIDITIKIGGEAGYGIMNTGLLLGKTLTAAGYYTYGYPEYPSLIRGGHNTYLTRVSDLPLDGPKEGVDILLALDSNTIARDLVYLNEHSDLIYDNEKIISPNLSRPKKVIGIPLEKIVKEVGGEPIMRNTVGLGALLSAFGLPFAHLEKEIRREFAKKSPEVVSKNLKAALAGYEAVPNNSSSHQHPLATPHNTEHFVATGNDILTIAAIGANLGFSAVYPMTPTHTILSLLKSLERLFPYQIIQPADEIEGIIMAIGASYSGKRAMVATSGGGFCLMVEGLGLASQLEVPLVLILGSRPGPATGLPTGTEQGDLKFALNAASGDFPRLVFTPGDIYECYELTKKAFDQSEKYQLPAIILVDKFLCENSVTVRSEKLSQNLTMSSNDSMVNLVTPTDGYFPRYAEGKHGVSPRPLPGINEVLTKTSADEHNIEGFIDESPENREAMIVRRHRKLETLAQENKGYTYFGKESPETLIVGWGSTLGPIREAVLSLNSNNGDFAQLHLNCWSPFPEAISTILTKAKNVVMVENNFSGQGGDVIREHTGFEIKNKLLKYDGRPIFQNDVIDYVRNL